eukprot:3217315-Prymnesium_polylepis.1
MSYDSRKKHLKVPRGLLGFSGKGPAPILKPAPILQPSWHRQPTDALRTRHYTCAITGHGRCPSAYAVHIKQWRLQAMKSTVLSALWPGLSVCHSRHSSKGHSNSGRAAHATRDISGASVRPLQCEQTLQQGPCGSGHLAAIVADIEMAAAEGASAHVAQHCRLRCGIRQPPACKRRRAQRRTVRRLRAHTASHKNGGGTAAR